MRASENITRHDFYDDSIVTDRPRFIGPAEFLFLTYILILPIESSDYLEFYIEFIHVSVVDILLLAVLYLVIIKRVGSHSRFSFLPFKFVLLFILTILSSTISLFYIPWNEDIAYDLKTTLNLFEYLSVFYITTSLVRDTVVLKRVLFMLCASLLVFSLLTILKSVGFDLPGYHRGDEVQVGPFNVGAVALFNGILPVSLLTLGAFPILISGVVVRRLWLIIPATGVVLLAAVLTYARSLWVALALQSFLCFYLMLYTRRNFLKRILFFAFIAALLVVMYLYLNKTYLFMEGIRPSTINSRISGYELGLDLVLSKIHYTFFGAGEGNFIQYYTWFTGEESVVHNFVINLLVSKGAVTLLLILYLISMIVYGLFKLRKTSSYMTNKYADLFILSIAGMLIQGMMAPITNSLIFWTYLAVAYSLILVTRRRESSLKYYI